MMLEQKHFLFETRSAFNPCFAIISSRAEGMLAVEPTKNGGPLQPKKTFP